MLQHVYHGSQAAFFELAATIIPVLVLGGVVTDHLRPEKGDSPLRVWNRFWAVPLFATTGVLTELIAIYAVASGSSSDLDRLLVSAFLTGSLLVIVGFLWMPWLNSIRSVNPKYADKWGRIGMWVGVSLLIMGTFLLAEGAKVGESTEGSNSYQTEYEHLEGSEISARHEIWTLRLQRVELRTAIQAARAEERPGRVVHALLKAWRWVGKFLVSAVFERMEIHREIRRIQSGSTVITASTL